MLYVFEKDTTSVLEIITTINLLCSSSVASGSLMIQTVVEISILIPK